MTSARHQMTVAVAEGMVWHLNRPLLYLGVDDRREHGV
jgi:hypothetical protein